MKKRIFALTMAFLLVLSLLTGCAQEKQPSNNPSSTSASDPATDPAGVPANDPATDPAGVPANDPVTAPAGERTVTDMSGREVTIDGEVKRIVNLWPSCTSSIIALGGGDLVCGIGSSTANAWTRFFYPGIDSVPVLGSTEPSIEDIVALKPDLVIVHPRSASSGYADQLVELGIPALNVNYSNYETMLRAYSILATALGGEYQTKLETWCAALQASIDSRSALTAGLTDADRPVVYYIAGMSDSPLRTMGNLSGGRPIMQDWTEGCGGQYGPALIGLAGEDITAEEVFHMNPDVILVGGPYQHVIVDQIQTENGWKDLNAVKNGRVYTIPYGCFNWDRFGVESLLQLDYAFLCIQPDIAAANSIDRAYMESAVIDLYAYYTGVTLTGTQAGYMLDGLQPDGTPEVK